MSPGIHKSSYFIVVFSILSLMLFIVPLIIPEAPTQSWYDAAANNMLRGFALILSIPVSLIGIIIAACYWSKIPTSVRIMPFITLLAFGSVFLYETLGNPTISSEIAYKGNQELVRVWFDHGGGGTGFNIKRNEIIKDSNVGHPTKHYAITIQDSETRSTLLKKEIDMTQVTRKFGSNRTLYVTITDIDILFNVKDTPY